LIGDLSGEIGHSCFDQTRVKLIDVLVSFLTLPYLRGGQVVTPAQRWGRISLAQCAAPV